VVSDRWAFLDAGCRACMFHHLQVALLSRT